MQPRLQLCEKSSQSMRYYRESKKKLGHKDSRTNGENWYRVTLVLKEQRYTIYQQKRSTIGEGYHVCHIYLQLQTVKIE